MKNTKFLLPLLISAAATSFAPALSATDLTWAGTGTTWNTEENNAVWTSGENNVAFASGDNVTFTADAAGKDVTVSESVTAGTIAVSGGTYTFSANSTENPETVSGSALTVSGGSATFNLSTNISGTVSVGNNTTVAFNGAETTLGSLLQAANATVAIGDGTNAAVVTTERFVGSATDTNGSTTGTLTINANSVLNVTGTSNSVSADTGSFLLANWSGTHTVAVNGVLNVASAVGTRDGTGVLNINDGGEANFTSGLTFVRNSGTIEVNLADGGRINVGSGGIGNSNFATLNLNGGTIGSLAESWSSTRALSLGGAVTIDTEKRTVSSTGKSTAAGTGSSVTLSGVISDGVDSDGQTLVGSLIKDGVGTLTLSNANTYSGGTTIKSGTLVAGNASALGKGAVSVASGATLENASGSSLSVGGLTTVSGAILAVDNASVFAGESASSAFASSGAVSISAGTIFDVDLLESATVTLVSGSSVSVDGEISSMGLDNLQFDGFVANSRAGTTASFAIDNGNLTLSYTAVKGEMTWNGGATQGGTSGVWVAKGTGWTGTKVGDTSTTLTDFQNGDNVTFGADYSGNNKHVTIDGAVVVDAMTVGNGYTFDGQNGATLKFDTLSGTLVKSGAGALTLSDSTFSSGAGVSVTQGTLALDSVSFESGSNFAVSGGTVTFDSVSFASGSSATVSSGGTLTLDGSTFASGSTINLSGGTVTASAATTIAANLVSAKDTTSTLDASNGKLTVSGTVTGTGTVNLTGGTVSFTNSGLNFGGTLVVDTDATLDFGYAGASTVETIIAEKNSTINLYQWNGLLGFTTLTMKGGSRLNFTNGNSGYGGGPIGGDNSKIVIDAKNSSVTLAGSSNGTGTNIRGTILGTGTLNLAQYYSNNWTISANIEDGDTDAGDVLALTVNLAASQQVTLSNANTYSGGTTIKSGTLVAGNNSALGKGDVTIDGGQLSVAENVTLNTNAISIVLSETYKSDSGVAAIIGSGSLAADTTISLSLDDAIASELATVGAEYSFQILGGSLSGSDIDESSFSSLGSSYELSYASDTGVLTITNVPEPSAFGLLAGPGALALVAARRRRSRKAA